MGQGKWHCLLSDFLSQNAKLAVRENSTFSILETEVTEDFFPTPISKVGKGSKLVKIVAAKIPVTLTLNCDFTYYAKCTFTNSDFDCTSNSICVSLVFD